jgi:MoaA/NifB/PqqE/SkfB family radical SAM enzyme
MNLSLISKILRRRNRNLALRELRQHKLKCKSRPHIIHLLSQYQCNYNCEFCGFDYHTRPVPGQLTIDNYRKIIANLHPSVLTEVVFSGQGESLLCKDFEQIVSHTRQQYPHIHLSINTNGELLTNDKCAFVAKHFDTVIVSLHSLKPQVYARLTGNDSLSKVIANIKTLRQHNPAIRLNLYFAYSMRNVGEICEHLKFCHELGNCSYSGVYTKFYSSKRRFSSRGDSGLNQILDPELSLYNHQEDSDRLVNEGMKYAATIGLAECSFPPLFSNIPTKRRDCPFPYTQIMVSVDGQIFPCGGSEVLLYDEITSGGLDFGNLLKSKIDLIWNKPDYIKLRDSSRGSCSRRPMQCCENCSTLGFMVESGNVPESHFVKIK